MDALFHEDSRMALFQARLIRDHYGTEDELRQYSDEALLCYIVDELVYLANSMRRSGHIIVCAERFFDVIILNNEFITISHAFTMTSMYNSTETEHMEFWHDRKTKTLQSCYADSDSIDGIPSRERVEQVSRSGPYNWNPSETLTCSDNQSEESFMEQRIAIDHITYHISKYRTPEASNAMTYTKNVIVHGAPGTGKHLLQRSPLLSQWVVD